jgi:hypothetical protein
MTRHEHRFTAGVLALALTTVGSAPAFGALRCVLSPEGNSITNQQATSAAGSGGATASQGTP